MCALFAFIPPCPPSGVLEADADQWERACDTLLMCIVTVLNHGLRNGGGVGDILRKPSKDVSFGSTLGPSLPSPAADPTVELPFLPGNCGTASFFPYSRPSVLSSSLPHHTPVIAPHLAPSAYGRCSKARLEWLEERCARRMSFFPFVHYRNPCFLLGLSTTSSSSSLSLSLSSTSSLGSLLTPLLT